MQWKGKRNELERRAWTQAGYSIRPFSAGVVEVSQTWSPMKHCRQVFSIHFLPDQTLWIVLSLIVAPDP